MKTAIENKITALFLGRTDKLTGLWFPIQKMTWIQSNSKYTDCITFFINGAKQLERLYPNQPNIVTFGSLNQIIKSETINSCPWSNRMPVSREPNLNVIRFLGLDTDSDLDPVRYVARDGGYRHGDLKNLFPQIEPDRFGKYNFYFRNVDSYSFSSPNKLGLDYIEKNDRILPQLDRGRLQLICRDLEIGYGPPHICELYKKYRDKLNITVDKVNPEAPFNYQFLLQANLDREVGIPFSEFDYQPIDQ